MFHYMCISFCLFISSIDGHRLLLALMNTAINMAIQISLKAPASTLLSLDPEVGLLVHMAVLLTF